MGVPSGELLRLLSGGVQPVEGGTPTTRDRFTLDFGAMLGRAQAGSLRTGLPVRVPLGLTPGVDETVRAELSEAADMAQREGIERAMVLVGRRGFRVDVRRREVIDAPDAQASAVGGIDGFVLRSPGETGEEDKPAPPPPATGPARVVRNTTLIDTLAGVRPGDD